MKKLKFLKIFLISFAVFCTISIGAVSSYMFFKNIAGSAVLATWVDEVESVTEPEILKKMSINSNGYYEIDSAIKLAWVSYKVNNGKKNNIKFILTDNIDLDGDNYDWVPIGDSDNPFQGIFNGNGHTISGLKISGSCKYAGLFGCVSGATIKNVVLSNPTITISGDENTGNLHVGSVAGYLNNESTIENVIVDTPKITAYHSITNSTICAGGAVGYMQNNSEVTRCYVMGSTGFVKSIGTVLGNSIQTGLCLTLYFGGVVGKVYNSSEISVCYSNVNVNTTYEKLRGYSDIKEQNVQEACAGGIAGVLEGSTIDQCYNTGSITSSSAGYSYSGGICGYQTGGTITNCFNTGEIKVSTAGYDSPNWYKQDEFEGKFTEISGYNKGGEYIKNTYVDKKIVFYVYTGNNNYTHLSFEDGTHLFFTSALKIAGQGYNIFIAKAAQNYQNEKGEVLKEPVEITNDKGYTGGIVAYINGGKINCCYNSGIIFTDKCKSTMHYYLAYRLIRNNDDKSSKPNMWNNTYMAAGVILDFKFDYKVNSGNIYGAANKDSETITDNYAFIDSEILLDLIWSQKLVERNSSYYVVNNVWDSDVIYYYYNNENRKPLGDDTYWSILKHENVECIMSQNNYGKWEFKNNIINSGEYDELTYIWDCYYFKEKDCYWYTTDTANTYLTVDLTKIKSINFYAQKIFTDDYGKIHVGDPTCYETIYTGIDMDKYATKETSDNKKTEVYKKEESCSFSLEKNDKKGYLQSNKTIAESLSSVDCAWGCESYINDGLPYLKAFYW